MNATDESFGELLLRGLREAVEIERGDAEPARRVLRRRAAMEDGSGASADDRRREDRRASR